ncbi:MAG: peptidoglycan DL-endopeptidase CwlO [Solirubrobacteraceae bacterium]|nr:peptidoglycan DL-endopeptidase CwlO [Solirubrobacteraceae bacterium]
MRRLPLVLVVSACLAPAQAQAAVPGLGTWDRAQQRAVVSAGVLPPLPDGRFGGELPLTAGQLSDALAAFGMPVTVPDRTVTVLGFDRLVVRALGLADVAATVQAAAAGAGLRPPAGFGSEVVARDLNLHFNHPFPQGEALEQYPSDPITRAEAAWSLATILDFSGWEVDEARASLGAFTLPVYTPAQRAALSVAVSRIGMPYVWGGETDGVSYGQDHGGYDCSGFVWRVFGQTGLAPALAGRSTADFMARDFPRRTRLHWEQLQPGDLMFFYKPIGHVAIVLGNGWLINSSSQGVFVQPMDGRRDVFRWGRRVL